jgi:hypothetical protein
MQTARRRQKKVVEQLSLGTRYCSCCLRICDALDISVLDGFSPSNEVQFDTALISPALHGAAHTRDGDGFRSAAQRPEALQFSLT